MSHVTFFLRGTKMLQVENNNPVMAIAILFLIMELEGKTTERKEFQRKLGYALIHYFITSDSLSSLRLNSSASVIS